MEFRVSSDMVQLVVIAWMIAMTALLVVTCYFSFFCYQWGRLIMEQQSVLIKQLGPVSELLVNLVEDLMSDRIPKTVNNRLDARLDTVDKRLDAITGGIKSLLDLAANTSSGSKVDLK